MDEQHDTLDQIREHLGSVSMHATVLMQNTVEDSDDWYQASRVLEHSEAVLAKFDALLAEGETYWRTVPQPENSFVAYRYQLGRREGDVVMSVSW